MGFWILKLYNIMSEIEKFENMIRIGYKYDPITGFIFGLNSNIILSKCDKGYIRFIVNFGNGYKNPIRKTIRGHRFAFYYIYKYIPEQVDHINRIKDDNRIVNIRDVDNGKNQFNRKNTKGYSFNKNYNKFNARIIFNKKYKSLGYYDTEEEAHSAYLKAKGKYHII